MKVRQTNVYEFDELDERAKERARDWWRTNGLQYEWWEFTYEDCVEAAKCLGIEIGNRAGRNMRGEATVGSPNIFFSGFSSQGDGACFEGAYGYHKGWREALAGYAPEDKELLSIGEALQSTQRSAFWGITASTRHSGHYYHSGCMLVEVRCDREIGNDAEAAVRYALRDFADWIYRNLREEYEYLMSDESVDETIRVNEYEFYESGERARA